MKWNNAKAHYALKKECEKMLALGMNEEQAQQIYEYGLKILNGNRREARHTQKLDLSSFDDELDEGKNPLLEKFAEALTVEIDRNDVNRYAWIDEIEDERVGAALKKLNESDAEFITLLIVDGYTQDDLAIKYGVHKSNISRRYTRIKNFIKSFL